jgi:hypothetical protein
VRRELSDAAAALLKVEPGAKVLEVALLCAVGADMGRCCKEEDNRGRVRPGRKTVELIRGTCVSVVHVRA